MRDCEILFDHVILSSEVNNFYEIEKELDTELLFYNLKKYFRSFGWDAKVINGNGKKLVLYFYGDCGRIYNCNLNNSIELLALSIDKEERDSLQHSTKTMVDFDQLEDYLEGFSILFRDFLERNINMYISRYKELIRYNPSIQLKGITMYMKVPTTVVHEVVLELSNSFQKELHCIEDFDSIFNLDNKVTISKKNDEKNLLTELQIRLRFSSSEAYTLSLSRFACDLPDHEIYRGIRAIAQKMFRFVWYQKFDEAKEFLRYEETKTLRNKEIKTKIEDLYNYLEKYQRYLFLRSLINRLSPLFPSRGNLELESNKLKKELEQGNFFEMCGYSHRDFRAFELRIHQLKTVIQQIIKTS